MKIELCITAAPEVLETIDRLSAAISNRGVCAPEHQALVAPPREIGPAKTTDEPAPSTPEPEVEPSGPEAVDHRAMLIEKLTDLGVAIPNRTRTTTLEKMLADEIEKRKAELQPPAPGAPVPPAPSAPIPPAAVENDPFAPEPEPPAAAPGEVTKEALSETLKRYVLGAPDEKTRNVRREEVRNALKQFGASSVAELDPSKYAAIKEMF
jgi:hypothetical protein